MSGDVHHVVDPAHDPEVVVRVAVRSVAREVDPVVAAPVLLAEAFRIAQMLRSIPGHGFSSTRKPPLGARTARPLSS